MFVAKLQGVKSLFNIILRLQLHERIFMVHRLIWCEVLDESVISSLHNILRLINKLMITPAYGVVLIQPIAWEMKWCKEWLRMLDHQHYITYWGEKSFELLSWETHLNYFHTIHESLPNHRTEKVVSNLSDPFLSWSLKYLKCESSCF